ncbi:MAG: hypothetical protein DRP45_02225 [Candidatus Zixiibacteriota bacterium]|nr:MAG: hypothetical protein DRP45_02225 [candidate division Zixibacteria bacterium]
MMCRLADKTVEDILRKGSIYEVGGAVRDKYLDVSKKSKDRDYLVTGIPYEELTGILRNHGRVDLVGRSFGVIKFTQSRYDKTYTFDITLPRREHSTGVSHKDFDVAFDPDLKVEDDLVRRDFTVNAMALSLEGDKLVDPLGGLADLKGRLLRMTSPTSFKEDPLRMLRAVQFAARFEFIIEPATFKAIREHASMVKTVSEERIAEELSKMLTLAPHPSDGFRIMQATGLLDEVLPELSKCVGVDQPGGYHKYDVFEHDIRCVDACAPSLRLRLAALFHDINKPQAKRLTDDGATFYGHEVTSARTAIRVLERLRFPKALASEVSTLVERHMFTTDVTDKGLRRLIRRVGKELIFDLLDLRRADVIAQGMGGTTEDVDELETAIREEILRQPPFGLSDVAISGHDIMRLFNLEPSHRVGEILDHLLEQVLDHPEFNTIEKLESLAKEYCEKTTECRDKDSKESNL